VFQKSGSRWVQVAKLVASDAVATSEFGSAVALSADEIVVGALQDLGTHDTRTACGACYLYKTTQLLKGPVVGRKGETK
jgi:hypothetical protein